MKILVCVKQVYDPEASVHPSDDATWVALDDDTFVMNRFDTYAVEEALRIREEIPATIDVISVGPDRAEAVVRRAMGMGADHGIHIFTRSEGYQNPFETAGLIAGYATDKGYDLVLAGVMSSDDMNGMVGQLIAEFLHFPCATSVISRQRMPESGRIRVEREMEDGWRDKLEIQLPALLTVQSGINQPRYPALSKMLRANSYPVEVIRPESLNPPSFPLFINQTALPVKTRAGRFIDGTPVEKACQLIGILKTRLAA
ncbi:MAG TPA: electron transfer flavoprotein subunit beta/FixA family protein [Desulfatirhabdiaceae bacterium]|nr:electron transfer flavoprotein subunit beta/FixA family protein [Desulfatirhabdiaceae bacterium]